MPLMPKQNIRQTGTPSPTPGDFLNTLLVVKDTVNATLLNEHTKLVDLSNILNEVEDQIRNAAEQTIKNLKTDFEKRRRKIVPGIKRLQDSLKSLSKSESKCKASERFCKNADAKKAKRRIRDAQKTLQDFTASDIELGVATFVADQITLLCQQLMQVPPKLKCDEVKYETTDIKRTEESDADSEDSSRVNTPTNHIYAEIDVWHSRNSAYITPRRSTCILEGTDDRKETLDKGSPIPRLNTVVLFSSDSDEDYGFGNTKNHNRAKRPMSAGGGSRQSRSNKKSNASKSKSPDYEILNKPTSKDVFREFVSTSMSPSRLGQHNHDMSPSPVLYDDYEKPIKREHESLHEPIKEYMKRMSPALKTENETREKEFTHTNYGKPIEDTDTYFVTKTQNESFPSSSRVTPKRMLPATPKHVPENKENIQHEQAFKRFQSTYFHPKFRQDTDEVDASLPEDTVDSVCLTTANNTVELLNAAQDFLDDSNILDRTYDMNIDTENSKIEPKAISTTISPRPLSQESDYVDLEEIKFRETVRSARREIIDKLKRKYAHSGNGSTLSNKDETDENNVDIGISNFQRSLLNNDHLSKYNVNEIKVSDQNLDHTSGSHDSKKVRDNTVMIQSKSLCNNDKNGNVCIGPANDSKENTVGVYRSKLIYTYDIDNHSDESKYKEKQEADSSNSLVTSTIKMFEKASAYDVHTCTRGRKHKPVVKYDVGARYRSASEPRTAISSSNGNSQKYLSNMKQPNTALRPRYESQNFESSGIENGENSSSESTNLTRSCTENDLLYLVKNESSSSIRRQWSKRRSSSMTPKSNDVRKRLGPTYEYWFSFLVPEQTSRCFVSAIVVLDDSSIVLLDERHSCLHLFDRAFKHKDQYRLLDIPRGCVKVNTETVAVAFPYKKCICTYCIKRGAILSGRKMSVQCGKWIVDIEFSNNYLYVLCKAGEIHILMDSGLEKHRISVGMNGIIFIPPTAKCIFILGEGRVSKFDVHGSFISSKADIDAQSMIFLENRIYVGDRQRQKLVPLSESADVENLTDMKIEYPSAMCSSLNGDILLVSQFEESMDMTSTRTIKVLKLERT